VVHGLLAVRHPKDGVSALSLQRPLEIGSYQTTWAMLHRLHSVLVRPGQDRLSGTVEVDESFIGGEEPGLPGGRAKGKKSLVGIAVERKESKGFGRYRMAVLADASTTCGSRMDRAPSGLNPEFRTPPLPATHVRAETNLEHGLGATSSLPTLQSTSPLDTSDFVSHHPADALLGGRRRLSTSRILPDRKGIRVSRPSTGTRSTGGSRLNAGS